MRGTETIDLTERAARDVVLLRAFEREDPDAIWSDDDRSWASRTAARSVGADADPAAFVARRAALGVDRLGLRDPRIEKIRHAFDFRAWTVFVVVSVAFVAGIAMDAIGPAHRVNVLSIPLLGLLAWNLAVYATILVSAAARAVRAARHGREDHEAREDAKVPRRRYGPLTRLVERLEHAYPRTSAMRPPLARFTTEWARLSSDLLGARATRALHLGSFAFALGAILALYARGIVFEYRAGWESTFLGAEGVHRLLAFALGPASRLSGIPIPSAAHLELLRFSSGIGENAAPYLHLYAITTALVVLVPRALLALVAYAREKRLERHVTISVDEAYFARILRAHRGDRALVRVVPYACHPTQAATHALETLLARFFGHDVELSIARTVDYGDEDDLPPGLVPRADLVLTLFHLATTPEAENHGAVVSAIAKLAGRTPHAVWVDESTFVARFPGNAKRRDERRKAWTRVLEAASETPTFVDLANPDVAAIEPSLAQALGVPRRGADA